MDRTERFYKIEQLLSARRVVSVDVFLDELGVSLATFKRDLEYLRDRLNMPVEWDRELRGYRYASGHSGASLPGMWFNASEVHALLMMQQLLADLGPGLLSAHVAPLQARLKALLDSGEHDAAEVERRFRLVHAARRVLPLKCFEVIASATLKRKRLAIVHFNRANGTEQGRVISPQQLLFYRDNWYVDAWCHLREGIRSFAIDAIRSAELLDEPAQEVAPQALQAHFEQGYGIFSGDQVNWAQLRFTPERARWVASEQWHPQQRATVESDGSYRLEVPYTDDRELLMDILKHGAEVEVLAPEALRLRLREMLQTALEKYR
jgi:predicted DNA-binding transcriptional regulator YafY